MIDVCGRTLLLASCPFPRYAIKNEIRIDKPNKITAYFEICNCLDLNLFAKKPTKVNNAKSVKMNGSLDPPIYKPLMHNIR
jgi:hypothetical protein